MKLFALLLTAASIALCAEYAVLVTGFRIEAENHELLGELMRLHTKDGTIDLPAGQVLGIEPKETLPMPAPPASIEPEPERFVAPTPQQLIDEAAIRNGLPPALVHSVAQVESGYQTDAVSPKGAIGVMQLMPSTAAALLADPLDVAQNIDAGARYLRELLLRYDGNLRLAIAAYNAGPGAVERYNGVPPFRETRSYVEKVLARYRGQRSR